MPTEELGVLDDRYDLQVVIGHGGMADVYRAFDQVLHRPVAVKVLRSGTTTRSEIRRFEAEARTLAQLRHTNLVTLLDLGESQGEPYLVMELVQGKTLAECCSSTALPAGQVARVGEQVATALQYAHSKGVIHRDVKPGNVLLADDGRVLLSDFGIARLVDQTQGHTKTGTTLGTPTYMSPEQVRGDVVSTSADIYSLGLVLLEALTGDRAFNGPVMEAALARLTTPPDIPTSLPAAWQRLIAGMTALEPRERPTAGEVAATLGALGAGRIGDANSAGKPRAGAATNATAATVPAQPQATSTPTSTPTPTRVMDTIVQNGSSLGRSRPAARTLLAISALLVLAVVVTAVVLATRDGGSSGTGLTKVPAGVPTRLQQPLDELHQAVAGSG